MHLVSNFYSNHIYETTKTDAQIHKIKNILTSKFLFKHKGKAIPIQALTSPEGSRRLRFPHFKTIGTLRWQGCQPYAPAALLSGNIPGTHFC
jgi:uncharacterized protein (DUF2237 family)